MLFRYYCQRSGIAAGREFIARQARELKTIEKLKFKLTTKSQIKIRPPEPLLIANRSRLFQRQALLAAILLLCVRSSIGHSKPVMIMMPFHKMNSQIYRHKMQIVYDSYQYFLLKLLLNISPVYLSCLFHPFLSEN